MAACWGQLRVGEKLYARLLEPIGDWEKYACFLEPI